MPFENTSIVVALKGEQILEMLNYFIAENKPHPLSGIQFTISKTNQPISILIQGKPLDMNRTYYVITSDYLANGGDKMDFFKKGTAKYDLNYKLRNILIDYFKENKTISASKDNRIIVE
jgi:2',3'-cyclic-nucleotide 2'-phosphodiesterase (5'-nucleotidase family)